MVDIITKLQEQQNILGEMGSHTDRTSTFLTYLPIDVLGFGDAERWVANPQPASKAFVRMQESKNTSKIRQS